MYLTSGCNILCLPNSKTEDDCPLFEILNLQFSSF